MRLNLAPVGADTGTGSATGGPASSGGAADAAGLDADRASSSVATRRAAADPPNGFTIRGATLKPASSAASATSCYRVTTVAVVVPSGDTHTRFAGRLWTRTSVLTVATSPLSRTTKRNSMSWL